MDNAFLLVMPPEGSVRWVTLDDAISTIGSDVTAAVRLKDSAVAGIHGEIHRRSHGYVFMRKGSPAWVNGRRSAAQPLADRDLITLGRTALSFRLGRPTPDLGISQIVVQGSGTDHSLKVLKSLYRLTRQLGDQPTDPAPVVQRILKDVVALTGAHRGMLVLFEGAAYRMAGELASRLGDFDGKETQLSQTAMAKIREERKARLWMDIDADADLAHAPSLHGASVRSLMAAPLLVGDRLLGALYLSKAETTDLFNEASLDLLSLYANQTALLIASAERDRQLLDQVERAERDLELVRGQAIVGSSFAMERLIGDLHKVARSNIPVLLLGETGTGKELLAREIHRVSDREDGPFVAVNCGAIPASLLETELFGHVRGAFTNATENRMGRIRSAEGGVLFLDEIGEMPLEQQSKLLRVIEQREVLPVGGDRAFSVDFRLICATNQTPQALVDQGRFRRDLYYRIADFVLEVPPLRKRGDDTIELARFFVERHAVLMKRPETRLSAAAMTAIRNHSWPGNVRELSAAIRRALVLAEGDLLQPEDLGLGAHEAAKETEEDSFIPGELEPLAQVRDTFLKKYVSAAVDRCGGNRTVAAKKLMVTPRTIFKYLEEV